MLLLLLLIEDIPDAIGQTVRCLKIILREVEQGRVTLAGSFNTVFIPYELRPVLVFESLKELLVGKTFSIVQSQLESVFEAEVLFYFVIVAFSLLKFLQKFRICLLEAIGAHAESLTIEAVLLVRVIHILRDPSLPLFDHFVNFLPHFCLATIRNVVKTVQVDELGAAKLGILAAFLDQCRLFLRHLLQLW